MSTINNYLIAGEKIDFKEIKNKFCDHKDIFPKENCGLRGDVYFTKEGGIFRHYKNGIEIWTNTENENTQIKNKLEKIIGLKLNFYANGKSKKNRTKD